MTLAKALPSTCMCVNRTGGLSNAEQNRLVEEKKVCVLHKQSLILILRWSARLLIDDV